MLEKVTSWIGCHFQAKGGCKAALLDLLCGAAALAAEYNGIENTPQVKEKLTTLMSWAEEAYAASIGAAVEGEKHPSGVWIPNLAMTSANKWLCLEHGGDQNNILLDIGGGIVTTAPQETEWDNPEIRGYMDKYLVGKREFSAIDRVRVMKLIEDLTTSEFGGFLRNMNPGGELQAARELVYSLYDIEDRKRTARVIAGLEEKDSIGFTWHR
jgi:aromatic ring hydroxylase